MEVQKQTEMKRVIIMHGWGGNPEGDWYQWLKLELENRGTEVIIPEMPDSMHPEIIEWVTTLAKSVGDPDEETYFVGHSIGCQTILRYLEALPRDKKVGGAVLVAAWFNLTDETWDEDYTEEIALPWLKTKIDFKKVREHTSKFTVFLSDNDPYVPLSDGEIFKKKLGAEVIVEKDRGHFSSEDGVYEYPAVLNKLLKRMR
jgi:uncharacterized protein